MNQKGGGDIVRPFAQPALLMTCGTEVSDLAVVPVVASPPPIFPQDSCVTRGRPRHISHSVWPDTGYRASFFGKRLHNTTVCRAKTNCLSGQTEPLAEKNIFKETYRLLSCFFY